MKKLSALVLAVCFVLGSLGSAAAVDVKVKGNWQFSFGYFGNWSMYDSNDGNPGRINNDLDPFQPRQRVRTQIDFVASETLSATLHFEIGHYTWGQTGSGFQLDTDGINVKTKWAALDWIIPQSKTHIRMGLHRLSLPALVFGTNFIFGADSAAIAVNQEFTPEVGLTAFWSRPYDVAPAGDSKNFDEMDMFALMLPVKTDVINITPWGAFAVIGKNSTYYQARPTGIAAAELGPDRNVINRGRHVPANARKDHAYAWWAGLSFELPVLDPFIAKFDAMYGSLSNDERGGVDYSQRGYYLAAQLGYKFDWGTTSLFGWYGSGDRGDSTDRYGTIPVVSTDDGFSPGIHAFGGNRYLQRDGGISNTGAGTWGVGFGLDNMSFAPNLTHGLRAFMFRGTNQGGRIEKTDFLYNAASGFDSGHNAYMVSSDFGFGAAFTNTYRFNSNLHMGLDFGYTHLDLSDQRRSDQRDTRDMYAAILSFGYSF